MAETLNFNIGGNSPYLPANSVEQNIAIINQQVAQLNALKSKLTGISSPVEGVIKIWENIDKEVATQMATFDDSILDSIEDWKQLREYLNDEYSIALSDLEIYEEL